MTFPFYLIFCVSFLVSSHATISTLTPAASSTRVPTRSPSASPSRAPSKPPSASPSYVSGVSPKIAFYSSSSCNKQLNSDTLPFQSYQSTSCKQILAENIYGVASTFYVQVICYGSDVDDYNKGSFSIQFYYSPTCTGSSVSSSSGYTNTLCIYDYMFNGYTYSSYDYTVDCSGGSSSSSSNSQVSSLTVLSGVFGAVGFFYAAILVYAAVFMCFYGRPKSA